MKLLLVTEAAQTLNASISHVYGLMKSGRLPYVRIGIGRQGGKRIRKEDLDRFIEENLVMEQEPAPSLKVKLKHLQL